MMTDRRRLMMACYAAGGSPSEAYIEYLEGVGGQRIATGISVVRGQTKVVIDCQYTANYSTTQLGVGMSDNGGQWFGNVGSKFGVGGQNTQKLGNSNIRTTITIEYLANSVTITDGNLSGYATFTPQQNPLYLFSVPQGYYSYMKIWSVQIYEGATLVADLRPYRIGTEGYLKDIVRDLDLGNIGTGSFTLGPDL